MKKTMVRIVAALLVAMLALTLLPMGAFAMEAVSDKREVPVDLFYFDQTKPTLYDYPIYGEAFSKQYYEGDTIKQSDFDKYKVHNGTLYDFSGLISWTDLDAAYENFFKNNPTPTPDQMEAFEENTGIPFTSKNLIIPTYPKNGTADEKIEWDYDWSWLFAAYTGHRHNLSRWYSDGTTHWKECLSCKTYLHHFNQFLYQNWCQDGDEDGICNVCGGDVPYHDITVIEEEGGKITVNRDNACHRMKITADVEPAEGYKLKKLHFTKVRDDGSEQEITRYKKNGQFWTYMPTYDLEVSAEFVKVKTKK